MDLILSEGIDPYDQIQRCLNGAQDEIVIFSPYIKVESIEKLELPERQKVSIITALRLGDFLSGSSDIGLYPYAKERNIKIFINNKIHLKVYMSDWASMVFGSTNLTRTGLGYDGTCNYELNGLVKSLNVDAIYYFRKIISESLLMDDDVYAYVKDVYDSNDKLNKPEEFEFGQLESYMEKDFLVSSLPMTRDINSLYELVNNNFRSENMMDVNCAIHDQLLYDLPNDVPFENFIEVLKENFFKSKFISSLLTFIDEEDRYFGAVKAWIQNNCADVPVPSRRDLTGNIQVLYSWISLLSDGQYEVDRPNHSERIRRVRK